MKRLPSVMKWAMQFAFNPPYMYKYKSIPDWKWAMQFAFNPPFLYTAAMCGQYIAQNRSKYFPRPPKVPHPNSIKTPDDYPEEKKRLIIPADKKRVKDEKKAKALAAEG